MKILLFRDELSTQWDNFVAESRMATFLLTRRFLSYHGSRFRDFSLIILDDKNNWLGVLPAAVSLHELSQIVSHPGATYGGLIHHGGLSGERMCEAFKQISQFYRQNSFRQLWYKCLPSVYHQQPREDDRWALFRMGAKLFRSDLSTATYLSRPFSLSRRRQRSIKKSKRSGVQVSEGRAHLKEFWVLLETYLIARHNRKPVHSIVEIENLIEKFPENIQLYIAEDDKKNLLAGIVIFKSARVWHSQYSMSSDEGNRVSALDSIYLQLESDARNANADYLDFGISTEQNGQFLNEGLYQYKTEFGGGGIVYDHYLIDF